MKLIDADKCPCSDCGINGPYNGCTKECIMFKKWLDSTAYDVDAVLHELSLNIEDCTTTNTIFNTHIYVRFSKAVNIIKRGGKK